MRAYWQRAWRPGGRRSGRCSRPTSTTAPGACRPAARISVFGDLHPTVRWHDGQIEVDRRHEQHVELGGRGMLLVPAAFAWPDVFALTDEPWEKALVYTPRGVGELWAPAEDGDPDALAALLGGRRRGDPGRAARARPRRSDLAALLGASAGGVSEHLSVLRRAGLVTAQRDGAPRPVPAHGRRRGPASARLRSDRPGIPPMIAARRPVRLARLMRSSS